MASIVIEDLPDLAELTEDEQLALWGAGLGGWATLAIGGAMLMNVAGHLPAPGEGWQQLRDGGAPGGGQAGIMRVMDAVQQGVQDTRNGVGIDGMVKDLEQLRQVQASLGLKAPTGDVVAGMRKAGFDMGGAGGDVELLETAKTLTGILGQLFDLLDGGKGGSGSALTKLNAMIDADLNAKTTG